MATLYSVIFSLSCNWLVGKPGNPFEQCSTRKFNGAILRSFGEVNNISGLALNTLLRSVSANFRCNTDWSVDVSFDSTCHRIDYWVSGSPAPATLPPLFKVSFPSLCISLYSCYHAKLLVITSDPHGAQPPVDSICPTYSRFRIFHSPPGSFVFLLGLWFTTFGTLGN